MGIDELREYCLKKKAVKEETPFGPDVLVYKVIGKIFLITSLGVDREFSVKCDPEKAIELREEYPTDVVPGYHLSKKHWNTVRMDGSVSNRLLKEWIDDSYNLIVDSLPKKDKEALANKK